MSERTMQAQRAQDLANRREVATFRLANAAAFAANMLTAEMHEPGRLSVRRDLWNALDEWRKLHGLPDGWPIDERLATPEPGGEGATLYRKRCGWCGAYEGTVDPQEPCAKDETGYIGPHEFGVLEEVERPTPAASEDVRESVEMAHFWLLHGEMTRSQRRAVADLLDQLALLRTPRGEGEAALVEAVLRRWNRLAADVEGSEGPLTETELVGIARDVAAALRSEAQGEGWQVTEPARDIVRREMPETRATVREAIRAARRGEGGGE